MQKDLNNIKPFLRWAGGKSWLVKHIQEILNPTCINNYHEPFLGGASTFLYLKSNNLINKKSFLSDQNEHLINAYEVLQKYPDNLIYRLKVYNNTKECYYIERNKHYTDNIERAAQFIFLNRTSFNGIYRVNQKGEYNVPYGFKKYKLLFDFNNLKKTNLLLNNVYFKVCDFEESITNIKKNDLVFLDPPYTVAHGKNGFIKYNQKLFAWEDQIRLKKYIDAINSIGAFFILTNAEHISISNLFRYVGNQYLLPRANLIGGKLAKRGRVNEYIFTNI